MHALRGLGTTLLVSAAVALASGPAQAQQKFPTKPIRVVIAFTPGSATDITSRLIAQKISDAWGQAIVIENRAGAGGTLAATVVAKATPDGYTLLATSGAFAIAAALRTDLPYDALKNFAGVSEIGYGTATIVASPSLGVKSVAELAELSKTKPGFLLFGSAGAATATHMSAERFRFAAGVEARHVAFKGHPEFVVEIMAGRIHFGSSSVTVSLPFIREGKLVALAVVTPQRSPMLPDVPTAREVVPGWGRDGSLAWLAPHGTPLAVRTKISEEMKRVLALPDIKERFDNFGFNVAPTTPGQHEKNLRADIEAFTKVGQQIGLRAK